MNVSVQYNDPDQGVTGDESVEFTFWFELDGTQTIEQVTDEILFVLENARIDGIQYRNTFRSPHVKLYGR